MGLKTAVAFSPCQNTQDANTNMMIEQLKNKIRHGLQPDNPALLSIWLSFEESLCQGCCQQKQFKAYIATVQFLMECYSDTLNPAHWRATCLDHMARPLSCLQRICYGSKQHAQLQALHMEINVLSHYFTPNFIPQNN